MFYVVIATFVVDLMVVSTVFYRMVNKGLSSSARHQQATRFGVASLLAMLPVAVAGHFPPSVPALAAVAVSLLWMATWPLLYHLSNRRVSPDYDNYMDIAAGMYLMGALLALLLAGGCGVKAVAVIAAVAAGAVEIAAMTLVIFQWVYFMLYRKAVDANGMTILQETNYNEIIEFCRSYPPIVSIAVGLAVTGAAVGLTALNVVGMTSADVAAPWWIALPELAIAVALTWMIVGGRRSPLRRCGLPALWLTVADYRRGCLRYAAGMKQRVASLEVAPRGLKSDTPGSILLIIGESAGRDWMSAFVPSMDHDTTPWLRSLVESGECIAFPHAYASAMHTVAVLEKSLTECSQYNDKTFLDSCSIIDVARKAGYRIHWYSNQGHLGSADTPVTLVADTADDAEWTRQRLNQVQYDEALLQFLDRVDPAASNLIVLHLKGSHFNFLNRYPADATVWGAPGVQDNEVNYMNSLRYTDSVMQRAFDLCRERFNLRAFCYFSDHATIPSRRRTPGFDGWGHVRIPLAVWTSPDYDSLHPGVRPALVANRDAFWTNDLFYDLMVGLLDVDCNRCDPTASLASTRYRFTRDDLLTFEGTIKINDDPNP